MGMDLGDFVNTTTPREGPFLWAPKQSSSLVCVECCCLLPRYPKSPTSNSAIASTSAKNLQEYYNLQQSYNLPPSVL